MLFSLVGGGGKTTLMYIWLRTAPARGVGGYWPLPPPISAARRGLGHRRMQTFSTCGSAALCVPEPLHTAAN